MREGGKAKTICASISHMAWQDIFTCPVVALSPSAFSLHFFIAFGCLDCSLGPVRSADSGPAVSQGLLWGVSQGLVAGVMVLQEQDISVGLR